MVLLIIASHYSTKVQRLTAQRALPVLATFFLLSFTGWLCTISFALFYYTIITHLPEMTITLVWSTDSSVPILVLTKFVMLFIMCLILMFILCLLIFYYSLKNYYGLVPSSHFWMSIWAYIITRFHTGLVCSCC